MGWSPGSESEWLTVGQAAKYLGVAQSTIRKWSDGGRLAAFYTPGGHRRYRRRDLDAFLERSGPGGRRNGPLVLVVDDDPSLRELIRVTLEAAGYAVAEAADATEALEAATGVEPALVLLDVVMPGVDGWEVLQRLQERHGAIPVIMFSGKVDATTVGEAAARGAQLFLGKPFDPLDLVERAKQLLPI